MSAAVIITPADIAKRAKMRSSDVAPDDEEAEGEDGGDYEEVKRSAAEDLIAALGVKNADTEAVMQALSDYHEACMGAPEAPESKAPKKVVD